MLTAEINDPNALWLKVVEHEEQDTAAHSDPIIAWMKANRPLHNSAVDTALPEWPEGSDKDLCDRFFSSCKKAFRTNGFGTSLVCVS